MGESSNTPHGGNHTPVSVELVDVFLVVAHTAGGRLDIGWADPLALPIAKCGRLDAQHLGGLGCVEQPRDAGAAGFLGFFGHDVKVSMD
jgi:hypothetical protein